VAEVYPIASGIRSERVLSQKFTAKNKLSSRGSVAQSKDLRLPSLQSSKNCHPERSEESVLGMFVHLCR
jgi:hypothetical protein